jgi:peroxiredoxin Q/BCP
MTTPESGDPAPEVALPDDAGVVHRLSEQRGRWTLVYFYPEDHTPGCTTEACQFRDLHPMLESEGLSVWGISPDSAASHAKFRQKFELPFTLLVDDGHRVADEYGAWGKKKNYGREYDGIIRSSFLVGPDGRIAHVWPKVKADGHAGDVLETYRSLRTAQPA